MISQIETEHPALPAVSAEQNVPLDNQNLTNNRLPHGVAPETYGLLLFARDHKEILNVVDALDKGKNRIVNPSRNLIGVYFGTEASIRDLAKAVGGDRATTKRRILDGLEVIWEHLPPELQSQYPKEKTVRLKDSTSISCWEARKRSNAAVTLWQDKNYREKTLQSLRNRKNDPNFITTMRAISEVRPSPMEGKTHSQKTVAKITNTTQQNWNKQHGIESNDPLAKKTALVAEWQRLSQLLEHSPSSTEITRLKREGKTRFSTTMYKQEFGQGSFAKAKEILAYFSSIQEFAVTLLQNPSKILTRSVLEKDVKAVHATVMSELSSILSASSIEEVEERTKALNGKISEIKRELNAKMHEYDLRIGEDEKSMWSYAVEHNLLPKMLQGNMLTHQEIDLLRRYFENGIIGEKLTVTIFDRFTVATAKIA